MSDATEKVMILNRGPRSYHLLDGTILGPGLSAEVSEAEAKGLLDYKDLVDASKIVKSPSTDALRKENAELRRQLEAAKRGEGAPEDEPEPTHTLEKEPPAHHAEPHRAAEHHGGKRTTRTR